MSSPNQNLKRDLNKDPDIEVGSDIWTNEVIKNLGIKGVKKVKSKIIQYILC